MYVFILREKECVSGEGQRDKERERERERERESQAGSELSARSRVWGSNPQPVRW